MADKKPDKKAAPAPAGRPVDLVIGEIVLLFLLLSGAFFLLARWLGILSFDDNSFFTATFVESFKIFFANLLSSLSAIAAFISLLFIMGIIYANFKIGQIKRAAKLKEKIQKATEKKAEQVKRTENKKWLKVKEHVASSNPSDWRLAILEADILLGELLTKQGYVGDTIAEQLKTVDKGDFHTLDLAWEGHKIRNSIAHEGSDFVLSPNEAKRVISLFEEVFKEFYFI